MFRARAIAIQVLCLSLSVVAQNVVTNPSTSQIVAQPTGTTLSANVDNEVRFASQFQWSQSPTMPVTLGNGTCTGTGPWVCTVTINAIRGIRPISVPGADNTTYTHHNLYLAGTGTPEVVQISGTTCTGASTGTCTVMFTAVNSHAMGYTLGTATAGWQEALVDAIDTNTAANPVMGFTIKGSPSPDKTKGIYVLKGTFNIDDVPGTQAPIIIDGQGATIQCQTSGKDCIRVGSQTLAGIPYFNELTGVSIHNFLFMPAAGLGRSGNGLTVALHDYVQGTKITNNHFGAALAPASDAFDYLIRIEQDEQFLVEGNNVNENNPPMICDHTFCGSAIFIADTGGAGGPGIVRNNQLTMECKGNAIDMQGGNGLTVSDNVIQNFNQFGIRYWEKAGFQFLNDMGGNYFEGSPACINPDFGAVSDGITHYVDYAVMGGIQVLFNGTTRGGDAPPLFLNEASATKRYAFYVVGVTSAGRKTTPLLLGAMYRATAPSAMLKWIPFPAPITGGETVTGYDILAADVTNNGTGDALAPYGTSDQITWNSIATGIACAATPCTFTVSFPVNLAGTAYQINYTNPWASALPYWPIGGVYLGARVACPQDIPFAGCVPTYVGPEYGSVIVTAGPTANSPYYYNMVLTALSQSAVGSTYTPVPARRIRMYSQNANGNAGGFVFPPVDDGSVVSGRKGKWNLASWSWSGSNSCNFTWFDSNPLKTWASLQSRPSLDVGDSCQGYDTSPNTMAWMNPTSYSWYVNHLMDNVSWKARLNASNFSLQTPLSTNSQISSTLATGTAPLVVASSTPVDTLTASNHPRIQGCGTSSACSATATTKGQIVFGTLTLAAGTATLTGISPAFTSSTSFRCVANDTTTQTNGVKAIPASASSVAFTGAGTDVISYQCVGN